MTGDFVIQDYTKAETLANEIKKTADNINAVFNTQNANIQALTEEEWQSHGAGVSRGEYQQLAASYVDHYQRIINACNVVLKVCENHKAADAAATNVMTNY